MVQGGGRSRGSKPLPLRPGKKEDVSGIEKRGYPRIPMVFLEIHGKTRDRFFVGYAENLSAGGFFLSARQALKVGDLFPVEFLLPDGKSKINCQCRVVWKRVQNTLGVLSEGVGIEFANISSTQRAVVRQWVNWEGKREG